MLGAHGLGIARCPQGGCWARVGWARQIVEVQWDEKTIKMVGLLVFCFVLFCFFPCWRLKLNMSDCLCEPSCSLLAVLMETRLRFFAPQQKGQHRGLGKNANIRLMVLCFRDVIEQSRLRVEEEPQGLGLLFFFLFLFFNLFPCIQ